MLYRRGVILPLGLLVLVVVGAVVRIAAGSPATPPAPRTAASDTATAAQPAAPLRVLDAVQDAYNAGDVAALCRPGRLVDAAVIEQQDAQPGGFAGASSRR
jgi:hypothetical protein